MVIHFNCQWKTRFYQANLDGFVVVAQFSFFFMYFILLESHNSNNIGLFTSTKEDFTWKTFFNWIIFANNSPNIFNFNWNWLSQWFFFLDLTSVNIRVLIFVENYSIVVHQHLLNINCYWNMLFSISTKLCLLRSNI